MYDISFILLTNALKVNLCFLLEYSSVHQQERKRIHHQQRKYYTEQELMNKT